MVAALRQQSATLLRSPVPPGTATLAGAPLAALRRQADRVGTIGRAGGPLPAAAAERLGRACGGGTPLAADSRASFEQALGADLGSVRLHAGPQANELNQQVGAQAFTIGRDIFFADGLPDVRTEPGQHLLAHAVAPAAGGAVHRAVVTQLQVAREKDDDERSPVRVLAVSIVGRPPPTFSGSMGDHTTAFTLHVNAVQLALVGHPLTEAAARMQDLVDGLLALPGAKLVTGLPARQAGMVQEAYKRLVTIHGQLASPGIGFDLAAGVQEYVAAYLELRELVPLSTINTGVVSKATAGKGKGEDCTALRQQAAGIPQPASALANEIVGLLDIRAVALACAEPDPGVLAMLAPGLSADLDMTGRAKLFVEQHLRSIQTGFPGVLAAMAEAGGQLPADPSVATATNPRAAARARDELALPFVAPELLYRTVLPRAAACLLEEMPSLRNSLLSLQKQIAEAQPAMTEPGKRARDPLDTGKASKEGQANLRNLQAQEQFRLARLNAIEKALGLPLTPAVDLSGRKIVTATREKRKSKSTIIYDPADFAEEIEARKHEEAVQKQMELLEAGEEDEVDSEELEEAEDRKGYLAIQVVLDGAGTITEVRSAGRPNSPFAGTMGAHTTAWTVHVDRVRRLIVDSSVAAALKLVNVTLAKERKEMAEALQPAFAFPADSHPPPASAPPGKHHDLVLLQNAIMAHLEAVNTIPGAALSAADTGGKSEGKHRRVLMEHLGLREYKDKKVPHTKRELVEAVAGLLDVASLLDDVSSDGRFAELTIDYEEAPLILLVSQHLANIDAAYPGVLKAAGLGSEGAVEKLIKEAQRDKKEGKAAKSKGRPNKRRKLGESGTDAESSTDPIASTSSISWDGKVFHPSSASSLFGTGPEFTGSVLGGLGSTLTGNEGSEAVGADWLDADGDLQNAQLPHFVAAYRADVAEPGVYLGQAEGPLVADQFGIRVHVYRDTIPGGFQQIENVGGGDCLIHAASDIRAAITLENGGTGRAAIPGMLGPAGGRAVDSAEIRRVRGVASAGMGDEAVENAVHDIVRNEVEGRGTQGLGMRIGSLLYNTGFQYRAALVRGKRVRKRAEEALAKAELAKVEAKTESPETKPETKSVSVPVVVAPIVERPQDTYGNNGPVSLNYALLHTGGNHYVALIRTS